MIANCLQVHGENLESKLGRFMCDVCKTGYCDRRLLYKHIRRVHLNIQFTREPLHTQKLINETWIERVVSKSATVSMTKVDNNMIVIKRLKIDVKPGVCEEKLVEYTQDAVDQYAKVKRFIYFLFVHLVLCSGMVQIGLEVWDVTTGSCGMWPQGTLDMTTGDMGGITTWDMTTGDMGHDHRGQGHELYMITGDRVQDIGWT